MVLDDVLKASAKDEIIKLESRSFLDRLMRDISKERKLITNKQSMRSRSYPPNWLNANNIIGLFHFFIQYVSMEEPKMNE